jgi:4-diphosphocytidyl-2-C-methyl-D-erythritol kinase
LGLGRGEEVYPLAELPRWWVVLIVPPFGVNTADAYSWLDELRSRKAAAPEARRLPGTWLGRTAGLMPLVNDLEQAVNARHPVIGSLMDRLMKLGAAMSAMSGSGSTVFGIFATAASARTALSALRKSGAHALLARMMPRTR